MAHNLDSKSRSTSMTVQCNVCRRQFDETSSLLIHAEVHRKRAKSTRCTRGCIEHYYDTEHELQGHLRHVHGIGVRGSFLRCDDYVKWMETMCRDASLHRMHGNVQQRRSVVSTCRSAQGVASLPLSQRLRQSLFYIATVIQSACRADARDNDRYGECKCAGKC